MAVAVPLALAVGCGGDDDIHCGPGTVLEGDQCVAVGPGDGEAPTVASIEPSSGLVGGGEQFTITGSGFENGGDTTVSFGDSVASFEIVSDTEITGTTPRASAAAVTVTVENAFGSADASFQYRGIYGADGKGAVAGNLYLVDPRDGTSVVIGPIESEAGPHAITGMAFDADGTLWATDATSGLDEGPAPPPQLMTIDPATGEATLVGPLFAGEATHRSVGGITFSGSTLLGWTSSGYGPVSIDTTSGDVTMLGAGFGGATFGNAIVAVDEMVVAFPRGASVGMENRGRYYSVDPANGDLAELGILGGTGSASMCGATMYHGTVIALLCPHLADLSGSVLATVDLSDGAMTNIAATTALGLDAIASDEPEAPAAGRFVAPTVSDPDLTPNHACGTAIRIATGSGVARTLASAQLATDANSVALPNRRRDVRGLPLARAAGSHDLDVVSCGGSSIRVSTADLARYALVENNRGLIKLVDATTGETLLRGVIEVRRP